MSSAQEWRCLGQAGSLTPGKEPGSPGGCAFGTNATQWCLTEAPPASGALLHAPSGKWRRNYCVHGKDSGASAGVFSCEERMRKPLPKEFEINDHGITHRPTEYSFHPFPGHPTQGSVRMGLLNKGLRADKRYDREAVRRMARKLWADYLARRK
jgi:hypothetical protein